MAAQFVCELHKQKVDGFQKTHINDKKFICTAANKLLDLMQILKKALLESIGNGLLRYGIECILFHSAAAAAGSFAS